MSSNKIPLALAILLLSISASSAAPPSREWLLPFGSHVSALASDTYYAVSCGTQGGPPAKAIGAPDQFGLCATEPSGLREVTYQYDDTERYFALSQRQTQLETRYRYNDIMQQPVISSLLFDDEGFLQGYRIHTDPRADIGTREDAFSALNYVSNIYGLEGWDCEATPQSEREQPYNGLYENKICRLETEDVTVTHGVRILRKVGQKQFDDRGNPTTGEFESSSFIEVLSSSRRQDSPGIVAQIDVANPPATPAEIFLAGLSGDCPGCDLSKVDLRWRDLTGADLSGAKLDSANLHRAVLVGANLKGASLERTNLNLADVRRANFDGANLQSATGYGLRGEAATFAEADLTRARFAHASFTRAVFDGAIVVDVDLEASRLNDVSMVRTDLSQSYAFSASFLRARIVDAKARQVSFGGGEFKDAILDGSDFTGSDFIDASLIDASAVNAVFDETRMSRANIFGANTDGASFDQVFY